MQSAINKQITHEFYAAHLYLSMSAYFETLNLPGLAHWMREQSQEERSHAMKLFDHINTRNGRVVLEAIPQPPMEIRSPVDAFEQSLEHEREVTKMIYQFYELAVEERDYATQMVLQWFITEQVEEEKQADMIAEQLKMVGEDSAALLMLDRELGNRATDSGAS